VASQERIEMIRASDAGKIWESKAWKEQENEKKWEKKKSKEQ
jgi:hypothetical protein